LIWIYLIPSKNLLDHSFGEWSFRVIHLQIEGKSSHSFSLSEIIDAGVLGGGRRRPIFLRFSKSRSSSLDCRGALERPPYRDPRFHGASFKAEHHRTGIFAHRVMAVAERCYFVASAQIGSRHIHDRTARVLLLRILIQGSDRFVCVDQLRPDRLALLMPADTGYEAARQEQAQASNCRNLLQDFSPCRAGTTSTADYDSTPS
jgi:hypothetical protein